MALANIHSRRFAEIEGIQSMREFLSRWYPIHRGYHILREQRDRWHYHWLCRRYGVRRYLERSSTLAREVLAIDLLRRATDQITWAPEQLYPGAAGAADHKFLFVLLRALEEFGFRNVLEIGAGETTRVLDAYAGHSGARVTTVEHDAQWISRLSRGGLTPSHQMVHGALKSFRDEVAGTYQWYDLEAMPEPEEPYDLVLVDGPPGALRWSRFGAVPFLEKHRASEFLALWDDADRVGELQTFGAWIAQLRLSTTPVDHHLFIGERTLAAAFTPKFAAVRYFF